MKELADDCVARMEMAKAHQGNAGQQFVETGDDRHARHRKIRP